MFKQAIEHTEDFKTTGLVNPLPYICYCIMKADILFLIHYPVIKETQVRTLLFVNTSIYASDK